MDLAIIVADIGTAGSLGWLQVADASTKEDTTVIVAIITAAGGVITTLGGTLLTHYLNRRQPQQPTSHPSDLLSQIKLDPTYQSPQPQPPIALGAVVRDAGLILILTAVAGLIIGLTSYTTDFESLLLLVACITLLFLVVGFTISASVVDRGRWQHIAAVGLMVWLFGIINVLVGIGSITDWFVSALLIAVCMGAGGALSYLFKRP